MTNTGGLSRTLGGASTSCLRGGDQGKSSIRGGNLKAAAGSLIGFGRRSGRPRLESSLKFRRGGEGLN